MNGATQTILCGEILTPNQHLKNAALVIEAGKVVSINPRPSGSPDVDASDGCVIPGLIDLQVNGALGWSFQAEHEAHFPEILNYHLRAGTTTLLPTLITAPERVLLNSLAVLSHFMESMANSAQGQPLPAVPGIHLEGPFLSAEKRGAHDETALRLPDLALARQFVEAANHTIRILTLAPELPGAEEVIRFAAAQGVVVSAGHTAARYTDLTRAIKAGLSFATHIGNASDWPHRAMGDLNFLTSEPGLVGTLMAEGGLGGSVIMDGFHFHPALLSPLLRLKSPNRLLLISDASTATGCAPGDYESGGLLLTVHPEGFATSGRGGGWLAGSIITLLQGVQRAVNLAKVPLHEAVHMATLGPARLIGIDQHKGRLEPGCDADFLILNRDLSLRQVFVNGQPVA